MFGSFWAQAFIFLAAAVAAVPFARRMGLGSALGYLLAGVLIGPYVLRLVGEEGQDVMHFAEFGVVMMLFLIGLELEPKKLWRMRRPILGLGGTQVLLTTAVIGGIASWAGLPFKAALTVGMVLALSSTAMVLQTMSEKGWMRTEAGQAGFSVLLFQDIAVIPMLALLPFLADPALVGMVEEGAHGQGGVGDPGWLQALQVLAAVGAMVLAGRYLARPAFRFIAESKTREIFIAAALLVVIGTSLLMESIGLSPALGAFLAGVALAESEYKHDLEATIEPFKGLLLGVFFIAVGASMDLTLIGERPLAIFGAVIALIVIKLGIMLALARLFRMSWASSWMAAFALAQGGEFAFLLFSFATRYRVLEVDLANSLIVVVVLSMMATPLTLIFYERYIQPICLKADQPPPDDDIEPREGAVIICGYGRFGQIVARMLNAVGIETVLLDRDVGQIELTARFGNKVFYGDVTNVDLLIAAGAADARLLVCAIDDVEDSVRLVEAAHHNFPELKVLARARDRRHAYQLMNAEADYVVRETFGSALMMGEEALTLLGWPPLRSHRITRTFMAHDEAGLRSLYELWGDDQAYGLRVKQNLADLEKVLKDDADTIEEHFGYVTDTAPPAPAPEAPKGALLSEKEIREQKHFEHMLGANRDDDAENEHPPSDKPSGVG